VLQNIRVPRILLALVAVSQIALVATAAAQERADDLAAPPEEEEESSSPVGVEALVGTTAPIDVHVGARAVAFDRIFVGASLGVSVYGGIMGAIAQSFGGEEVGDIAEELGNGVVVFRAGGGVRPFGGGGPELVVSYALLHRSATLDLATLAQAWDLSAPQSDVDVSLTVHAVHFEFGWTIDIADSFLIRPAFGWLHPIDGGARLAVASADTERERRVVSEVETRLEDALTSYVMTPTISVSAGWRF
jgi:hypothetical protein